MAFHSHVRKHANFKFHTV